ncbi:wax ester synthase-like Acyl-CoA acyltransferase domain protein [Mycobacterium kansasii]|uniref:Wax ester synthase-like Acyl-CoA acyltransferase domain protein n=1 Tax=Mycobacterium kansasii TaxID=1768 RepID=A0A1V3WGJ8_MYCKA|nr:wax ester synthase-like Acyl-CoA acyltransferase domain protein [Mycobacterium kansasii]
MNPLDPLDAAMMTAEMLSNPMHVGAVLILSPPPGAGPEYVDELYRETQAGNDPIDPRLRRYPHQGVDTGASGSGVTPTPLTSGNTASGAPSPLTMRDSGG